MNYDELSELTKGQVQYFINVKLKKDKIMTEFTGKIKNVCVKVESIDTGEVVKNFDCGVDADKASKLEEALNNKTDLSSYFVYQSIEV